MKSRISLKFNEGLSMNMERYTKEYLESYDFESLERELLQETGLPNRPSSVQDCLIPLEIFYDFKYQETTYLVLASCSDLFPDRAFITYHTKCKTMHFFYRNVQNNWKERYVNASLSNFIRSRMLYESFKLELKSLYKMRIVEGERSLDDAFFTTEVSRSYKAVISDLQELDKGAYQSLNAYWVDLLMSIPMNFSDHFQCINENFDLLSTS